jgi:hypothetical protein
MDAQRKRLFAERSRQRYVRSDFSLALGERF